MSTLGIIHYNLPKEWSLSDFFRYCRETGFQVMELQIGDVWDESDPSSDPRQGADYTAERHRSQPMRASVQIVSSHF